jgi:hypothetical protein
LRCKFACEKLVVEFYFFEKKLAVLNLLNFETKTDFEVKKLLAENWLLTADRKPKWRNKPRNFASRRARLRETKRPKSAGINQKLKTSQKFC